MKNRALRETVFVPDLYLQIDSPAVDRHIDIEPAEFVSKRFRRHLWIRYHELADTLVPNINQLRDEPFQQVGVFHKEHFEQRIVLERIFQPIHRYTS
jgi:hypothetical protein